MVFSFLTRTALTSLAFPTARLLTPFPAMASTLPPCANLPIHSQLRVWLDPLPHQRPGALPPGIIAPPAPPRGPETHALNVELSLLNPSRQNHRARVVSAHWHQGEHTHALQWRQQPDLSPLNRFSHIQRQLVVLNTGSPVQVELIVDLDGRRCRLADSIPVDQRSDARP